MRLTKQSSCPAPSVGAASGGGTATGNESFVTINDDTATLPNSRQITAGTGINIVDGGAGNPVTINADYTKVEQDQCINAAHFVPAQSPFSPAPIENYYIAASGFAGKVIRLNPGEMTAASCFWSNRWIAKPGTAFYTILAQVNFFTDNASTNNLILDLYHKSGSYPAFDLSTAPVSIGAKTIAGLGSYIQNRTLFQFNTSGDNFQFVIERQGAEAGDTNPGTIYIQSIMMYFGVTLS